MLSTRSLTLGFGGQPVLENVSLTIHDGSRAGLVGANGSGKTTLLKILAGEASPDSGEAFLAKGRTLAYLPQRQEIPPETTLHQFCEDGFRRERALAEARQAAADRLTLDPHNTSALAELADLDTRLEVSGYHHRHVEINRTLHGLGFAAGDEKRYLREFSGGWRMRGALARTLLTRPDVLLLDEPTNYLDSEARSWLADFLKRFSGSFILVSHDRAFLDETIQEVLELFQGTIRRYKGNYTAYERKREEELAQLVVAWEEQQREIARQEEFIRRFRAQANRATQVQSRVKQLERIERISIPEHLRPVTISLPPAPRSGDIVVELQDLCRRYGDNLVLNGLSFTLNRGQRLAVAGRNGAGKSTLLRILAAVDQPDSGSLRLGTGVLPAYFAQESPEQLPTGETVRTYLEHLASKETLPRIRDILGAFLFSGDAVEKPLEVLSGGERSRLAMAGLLVRPVNLLVLDEPTNHLDITSQRVLSDALRQYSGTVVMVSHDRFFLHAVATDVLALWAETGEGVPPQKWQLYPGPYREFEKSAIGQVFYQPAATASVVRSALQDQAAGSYREQKALKQEMRKLEREEQELLLQIEQEEERHSRIQQRMSREDVYTDVAEITRLQGELQQSEKEQERLHEQWENVSARLEEIGD